LAALFHFCQLSLSGSTTVLWLPLLSLIQIKQIEQVADGGHVGWDVGIVFVKSRIGQIVAAAIAERGVEHPIAFDEFHERGMLGIDVADMASPRERRNDDHRNAGAGAEEIDWLDKAGVVEAAALKPFTLFG
jgi:hypothetical protein